MISKLFYFGSYQRKFLLDLKDKIRLKKFSNLKITLRELFKELKKDDSNKKTVFMSNVNYACISLETFRPVKMPPLFRECYRVTT